MKKFLLALCFGLIMASNALAQVIIDGTEMASPGYSYTVQVTKSVESVEIGEGSTLIIPDGVALTVTGTVKSPAVTCLIIEDGGQLINGSNDVNATVYKTIPQYTNDSDGWYTISSPVVIGDFATQTNLIASDPENYDFFTYIEDMQLWFSYIDDDGTMFAKDPCTGYLYAQKGNNSDRFFEGVLNCASEYIAIPLSHSAVGSLAGFNLIGNPYPHNIYKAPGEQGKTYGITEDTDKMATGYYVLENTNQWGTKRCNDAIKPCQSILVEAYNNNVITIKKSTESPSASKNEYNYSIGLSVSGTSGSDRAFVNFNNDLGLHKIDNFTDVPPVLCVRYDDSDYAIACVGEQCNSLDVVFKTTQSGFFTIQLSELVGDYNYLHLIDNVTGDDIDLLKEESYKFYSFGNENDSRFKLLTSSNAGISITDNDTFAYILNGDIIITGLEGNATLQVFDVMGRLVGNEVVCGTSGVVCRANKPNTTGVYVLRLISGNGIKTQKIVVE